VRTAPGDCKNLTRSVPDGDVISRRAESEIHRWADAGKFLEIVDKVRLIKIPARHRDFGPIDLPERLDDAKDVLKPAQTGKGLRSHADMVAKRFDEPTLAHADVVDNLRDRPRTDVTGPHESITRVR